MSDINPYRAPQTAGSRPAGTASEPDAGFRRKSLPRVALRWFFICGFSAIPSFTIGLSEANSPAGAMIVGIILFACGYTAMDYMTATTAIRRKASVSRTLTIAYGTRIAVTILFPLAMGIDLVCGMVSVGFCEIVLGSQSIALKTFGGALFTTLVQGVVMNVVIAAYAVVVHLFQLLAISVWKGIPTG